MVLYIGPFSGFPEYRPLYKGFKYPSIFLPKTFLFIFPERVMVFLKDIHENFKLGRKRP